MTRFHTRLGAALATLVFSAQGVWADVSPSEVWQDWQDYMQGMGYSLTGQESLTDGKLAVSDVQFDLSMDADQGQVSMSIASLDLVQNSDGTVSIIMPEVMPVKMAVTPADGTGKPVQIDMTVSQTNHNMIVSGTPAAMTSRYSSGLLGLRLDRLTVGDQGFGAQNARFNALMTDVENTTTTTVGTTRDYAQNGTIRALTYDMRFKNPNEPAIAQIAGTSSDLAIKAQGVLPIGLTQVRDMAGMLRAGMDVSGTLSAGNSTATVDITDPNDGDLSAAAAAEGSTLTVETSADGVSYAGTRQGIAVSVQSAQLPLPLSFAMDTAAFNLSAPVMKSDAPQDFAIGLNLGDLTLSDVLWGMFDPQAKLSRDPASLALDLTGKLTLLMDYFDPKAAEQATETGTFPGQLDGLNVNSLIVHALGARLTGNGSVTFDNDSADADADADPRPDLLKPVGAIDLRLVGGNTLIDQLTAAGLVPAQLAMGARLMMGMFAVPGDGDDTLMTKLEFTRSGAILANGQRIR